MIILLIFLDNRNNHHNLLIMQYVTLSFLNYKHHSYTSYEWVLFLFLMTINYINLHTFISAGET